MSFRNTKTPTKPTKKAKWQVPMRKNAAGPMEYYLEGELKEKFCKLFPKHSNRRIMEWFGLSHTTVRRFKQELGLEKDMKAIRKELAKDVKKICEKNGYYDSIRGKAPSEACMEATRKIRAEGYHPITQLKATNPRKFKRWKQKMSENRKLLWEKERRRVKWGLEQKTKLRVSLYKLSHKASVQKNLMISLCNYFSHPEHRSWVCYDSETRRSEKREATAVRYGLHIVNADEE